VNHRLGFLVLLAAICPAGAHAQPVAGASEGAGYFKGIRGDYTATEERWWKGNTHTHSWWSDGDSAPEIAAAWYREHGYDFVVISDHNIMQKGVLPRGDFVQTPTFWYAIERDGRAQALATYRKHFGPDWVETRIRNGVTEVRLKTLDEFRHLFEAPGKFIFVPGEEITASFEDHPVHMNGINLQDVLAPRTGRSVAEVMQNNLNAVLDHGIASGREVIAHVNHPNFQYAVTVEDLVALEHAAGEGFFEVYNGHNAVENYGDVARVGTERMWDIVLAQRLGRHNRAVLYGIANDDAHNFALWELEERSNPGRGWVMVRALRLTPDVIVAAMKRGDFYNSTGVVLRELVREGDTLSLALEPESGVDYTIEFIGTRKGADLAARPAHGAPPGATGRISDRYSEEIGVVLQTVRGKQARYEMKGDELYVRARVTSSAPHPHGHRAGDVQMAWTQPLVPANTAPR
jgi:hypothetical protein